MLPQSNAKSKTKILLIEDAHYKHKNIMSVLDDAQYEVCCVLDVYKFVCGQFGQL